tara:strand:+ start:441 stop:755 length:315 start_codon:yes stop_codon:yes gene_type:complete
LKLAILIRLQPEYRLPVRTLKDKNFFVLQLCFQASAHLRMSATSGLIYSLACLSSFNLSLSQSFTGCESRPISEKFQGEFAAFGGGGSQFARRGKFDQDIDQPF